ncbi:MAG: YeiH family protein [Rhizobacter sp.]
MLTPASLAPRTVGPAVLAALSLRWRGSLLCGVIALAATFMARSHGGPQLLYALLFGIGFHFLAAHADTHAGIEFCSRVLLRVGVALLGARITVDQIAALGWPTAALVVTAVATTLAFGLLMSRWLGLGSMLGVLSGGATAICGASAAMALSAVLPRTRDSERMTLVVVLSVTGLSTLAMVLYPMLAHALALPPAHAGVFLGATIHDVAQVVGAGYAMGPAIGDHATVVKLMRVSLLVVVVVAVGVSLRGARTDGARGGPPVPAFMVAFGLLVVLHSLGWVPRAWEAPLGELSRACLVVAIAGLGVRTSFSTLVLAGWRCFALLLAETAWLAAWVLGGLHLMGEAIG